MTESHPRQRVLTPLMAGWKWFWQQSWFNKIVILGLLAAVIPFFLPTVVAWFRPTMIKVGVAFYTYERAYEVDGQSRTYFFEKRNLVTNCSLRRVERLISNGPVRAPDSKSWVVIKLLLENTSDQAITNLRLGVRSPALGLSTELVTSENVTAAGSIETPPRDSRRAYMISVEALPPNASAVLSLRTVIDEGLRKFIYENHRTVTIQVPFVSSDQFHEYPPIVSRTNALKILNREGVLRTDNEMPEIEALAFDALPPDALELGGATPSYQLLPKTRPCSEAEAGIW